jgi:hypothetical protein
MNAHQSNGACSCEQGRPALKNISMIIDFEGFHTCRGFHIKECGYIELDEGIPHSFFVHLPLTFEQLNLKERRTAAFVTNRIHGLLYENHPGDWDFNEMMIFLEEKYKAQHAKNENAVVAYKGGQIELDILRKLKIPSINLECLGLTCKYEQLLNEYGVPTGIVKCARHLERDGIHCPVVELYVFAKWLKNAYNFIDNRGSA